jgi:3,4-dihydroxy 2-butanone 4-phosphate synthase
MACHELKPCRANSAANKFVLVMDDEDRENEGDLIIAAKNVTTEQMAFLIRYSRYTREKT